MYFIYYISLGSNEPVARIRQSVVLIVHGHSCVYETLVQKSKCEAYSTNMAMLINKVLLHYVNILLNTLILAVKYLHTIF